MNPNEIQHGGDHYKAAVQHWDMLAACGFGWEYYVGRATAYLTRVKDPSLDAHKAVHFCDKLISLVQEGKVPAKFQTAQGNRLFSDGGNMLQSERVNVEDYLRAYGAAYNLNAPSLAAIGQLMMARTLEDLVAARESCAVLLPAEQPKAPAPPPAVVAQVPKDPDDTPKEFDALLRDAVVKEPQDDGEFDALAEKPTKLKKRPHR